MTRRIRSTLLMWLVLAWTTSVSAHMETPSDQVDAGSLPAVLRQTPSVRLAPSPIPGLQQVTAGRNVFYITPDGHYLLIGRILRGTDGSDVTAEAEQAALVPFFRDFVAAAPIRWGSGSRQLLVFLDPDCPYCRQTWTALRQLQDIEIAVHLLGAPASLAHILCSDHPLEQLDRHFATGAQPGPLCDKIQEARRWTTLAHVEGTPAFLSDSLQWRYGVQPLDALQHWMAGSPAVPSSTPKEGTMP